MFTVKIISENGSVKLESMNSVISFNKGTEEFAEHEKLEGSTPECKAYLIDFDDESMDNNLGEETILPYNQCVVIFENEKCYITDAHGNTVQVIS